MVRKDTPCQPLASRKRIGIEVSIPENVGNVYGRLVAIRFNRIIYSVSLFLGTRM